jgi:hypothetical protein
MELSLDFKNNFLFHYAVFIRVLIYVISLSTVEFDSSNCLGGGDAFNCPIIVSIIGNTWSSSSSFYRAPGS